MTRNIPGTDFELSTKGISGAYERAKEKGGIFFLLFLFVLIPLLVLTLLGGLLMVVAGIVFAIQGLVVGARTYQGGFQNCQYIPGYWMIVFGSLLLGTLILPCCCPPVGPMKTTAATCGFLIFLILALATLAWICYGVHLVYYPSPFYQCNPSQYTIFDRIVMFMFWGIIALIAALLLLTCCAIPILGGGVAKAAAATAREEDRNRMGNVGVNQQQYTVSTTTTNAAAGLQPAQYEPARYEPAKYEPARFEPAKFEPAKYEPPKAELNVV
jgi:hypothetical protein